MRTNSLLFVLPIIVVFIYVYNVFNINQNLDSLSDEGYLFLMIQAAHNGIHDGFSQWPTIIDVVFGNIITSNILYLRYARFFLHLLSISLFYFTTNWYLSKKGFLKSFEQKVFFITIIYLLGAISFSSIAISYNTLQEFFLLAVIGIYLISNVCDSKHINIYYSLIGFFSFFAISNVLPSGILVTLTVILMKFIKNSTEWKKSIVSTFWIFLGMFIAALIFHYSFLSLEIVFENMSKTFNSVKEWGAGYDSKSFLINVFIYFRDLFMGLSLLFGAVVFSYFVSKFLGKWFGFFILISSMILFSVYQIKPQLPLSTFLAFPLVMLIMLKFSATKEFDIKKLFSFEFIFYLFLFILPLLSTIGTNLYLGSKMILFILPWGVLFVELIENIELNVLYKLETKLIRILFIGILLMYSVIKIMDNIPSKANDNVFFRKDSPISQIKLSNQQLTYFDNVDSILKMYGYRPNEYFFSTQLDHMTMVAFDATPHGIYFFPTMFLIDSNKKKECKPDFLFLNNYDLKLMGDSIKSLGWGFPEAYDSIYVGTPETQKMSYSTERTLYCLKTRKLKR